jgi:hypothetical protein
MDPEWRKLRPVFLRFAGRQNLARDDLLQAMANALGDHGWGSRTLMAQKAVDRYGSLVQNAPEDAYNVADEAAVKAWHGP